MSAERVSLGLLLSALLGHMSARQQSREGEEEEEQSVQEALFAQICLFFDATKPALVSMLSMFDSIHPLPPPGFFDTVDSSLGELNPKPFFSR